MPKYLFFGLTILGLFISFRITERQKKESDQNGGCFYYGFVTLIFEALLLLSFGALALSGSGLFRNIFDTSYQAIVVDQVEYESEDDDGNTTTMHTPIVKFTPDGQHAPIIAKLNISSGGEYEIGATHRIVFDPETGDVTSGATSTILLLLGGLIMGLFMFSFIVYGFCYAFYLPLPFSLSDIIAVGFIYTFLPLGVIGMDAGLLYYIYERMIGARTGEPIWPLLLSILFSTILTLLIGLTAFNFIKNGSFRSFFIKSSNKK